MSSLSWRRIIWYFAFYQKFKNADAKHIKIYECIIEKLDRPESWLQLFQISGIRNRNKRIRNKFSEIRNKNMHSKKVDCSHISFCSWIKPFLANILFFNKKVPLPKRVYKKSHCIIEKLDRPESWLQPFQFSEIKYFCASILFLEKAKSPVLKIFLPFGISGKGNFHALPQTFKLNSWKPENLIWKFQ